MNESQQRASGYGIPKQRGSEKVLEPPKLTEKESEKIPPKTKEWLMNTQAKSVPTSKTS